MQVVFIFLCNQKAECMVTLSLDLYKKKELKSSRSVDDFACSGQGHAAQNRSSSRLSTGAVARRSGNLMPSHHWNAPAPAQRAGTAPFSMMDVVTSIQPHVFNRWNIEEHARKRPCGPLTRRYAPAAAKPCRDHSDRAQTDW